MLLFVLVFAAVPGRAQDPLAAPRQTKVNGFEIALDKCVKSGTKSIRCQFTITNKQADRKLSLYGAGGEASYFVDAGGQEIRATRAQLGTASGNRSASTETVTDIAVAANLEFGVGDPKATSLAKLSIGLSVGRPFRAEFRKVPLEGE